MLFPLSLRVFVFQIVYFKLFFALELLKNSYKANWILFSLSDFNSFDKLSVNLLEISYFSQFTSNEYSILDSLYQLLSRFLAYFLIQSFEFNTFKVTNGKFEKIEWWKKRV